MLPPVNVGRRILAALLDLTLIFFLSLFIIGKLWLPIHWAEVFVQFKILLENYTQQLQVGQFSEFLKQVNENKSILEMFISVDRLLFFITWGYYVLNAFFLQGNTLGKQVLNLKVLKITTLKPPSWGECILRSGILTFFMFTAWPFLMVFNLCFTGISTLHRGIHDWFCQTYVVNCDIIEDVVTKIRQVLNENNHTPS